jgi:hypothetical protein
MEHEAIGRAGGRARRRKSVWGAILIASLITVIIVVAMGFAVAYL